MRMLRNIREFFTPEYVETMKYSTRNVTCAQVMLINKLEPDENNVHGMVLHVFDKDGNFIGTIKNPELIPD